MASEAGEVERLKGETRTAIRAVYDYALDGDSHNAIIAEGRAHSRLDALIAAVRADERERRDREWLEALPHNVSMSGNFPRHDSRKAANEMGYEWTDHLWVNGEHQGGVFRKIEEVRE